MLSTESRTQTTPDPPLIRSRIDTREWLQERISGRAAVTVGIAWVVLMEIAFALEPAAQGSVPFVGILLELSMYLLLVTMIAGLVMQRRFGLVASLGGAVLATAASIACPVTGHHSFGLWWFGQMACVLALVAISTVAVKRRYE